MHATSPTKHDFMLHSRLGHLPTRAYAAWAVLALGVALSLVAGGVARQVAADGVRAQFIDSLFVWMVLLGGLVTSVLFAGLGAALSGAHRRALKLAKTMAHPLRHRVGSLAAAQQLAQLGNWSDDLKKRRVECSEEAGCSGGLGGEGFSHLQIDRSFIKDIPADNDDATITRTIIAMAHNLRLKVIAEGVETKVQLEFLCQHGCDEIRGLLLQPPAARGRVCRTAAGARKAGGSRGLSPRRTQPGKV